MESHASDPILDFHDLSVNAPTQNRKEALKLLDNAFRTHGFVYLSNHSIPQSLIDESFEWTKSFFAFPQDIKCLIRRSSNPLDCRGYTTVGDAIVNQEEQPRDLEELGKARSSAALEQRETLELGDPYASNKDINRLLPEEIFPGFSSWLIRWWDACLALQLELMARLGEILSAESTNADVLVKQQTSSCNGSNMSLIHYHSMPYADLHAQNKSSRCNAHTDSGQLTLLFQDGVGGLEVSSEGIDQCPARFVPVPLRPGTMIVQLGDMLEKQSNGRWRSALHRVTAPPLEATRNQPNIQDTKLDRFLEDRYSIAFFVYPDFDTVIETLPGCEQKGPWNSLDWGNVQTAGDWWRKRIELEFGNMKPASITR